MEQEKAAKRHEINQMKIMSFDILIKSGHKPATPEQFVSDAKVLHNWLIEEPVIVPDSGLIKLK